MRYIEYFPFVPCYPIKGSRASAFYVTDYERNRSLYLRDVSKPVVYPVLGQQHIGYLSGAERYISDYE